MSTILGLLNQSLMLCGMRASGETVDAALAQDALDTLNQMIAGWALDSLLVYQIERQVISMTTSQTYTVGVGGTIPLPRPVRIEAVNWRDEAQVPALELPLHKMEQQEYQSQSVRETAASMPTAYYYDQAFPLGLLFLWPRPTETKKLVLFLWHPWNSAQVLSDTVAMPPGYERMLVYNLALELSAQPGARLSPVAVRLAEQSKVAIEILNARIPMLSVPSGLGGGSGFNPLTGE